MAGIFALCLFSIPALAQPKALIMVTAPTDTVGVCRPNIFEVKVKAPGARLLINNSVQNGSSNCGTTVFVKLEVVSVTGNLSAVYVNNNKLSVTANTTDTLVVRYSAKVDCANINPNNSLDLKQVFGDSTNVYSIVTDTVTNSHVYTTTAIHFPAIADRTPTLQNVRYLTPDYLYFYFQNSNIGSAANINFRFVADTLNNCTDLNRYQLEFSKGMNGPFYAYTSGATGLISLNSLDTLIIRQSVKDTTCLGSACNAAYSFRWYCNYANTNGVFCNECLGSVLSRLYTIVAYDTQKLQVERITPASGLYDLSCPNDTSQSVYWLYRFTNTGPGVIDSVTYTFNNLGALSGSLAYLTLIPRATVKLTSHCSSCTVDTVYTNRTAALCSSIWGGDMLHSAKVSIKSLGEKDTVWFSFTTFKCSEKNDSALLNQRKIYNKWSFEKLKAKTVCGGGLSLQLDNASAYTQTLFSGYGISGMANDAGDDVTQKLQFFPAVSDLEVPMGQPGDTALLTVDLKGMIAAKGAYEYDYQLLGCTLPGTPTAAGCTLGGYVKAVITCETNLKVKNPQSNVRLKYMDAQGNYVYINPIYYNTALLSTQCIGGDYSFYFNLNDTNAVKFINNGQLDFVLQACCGEGPNPTHYQVKFYLLASPNGCTALNIPSGNTNEPVISGKNDWLPLAGRLNEEIQIHCPGCLAPGAIAQRYYMKRTTFGLRDDNDDNWANDPVIQITDTSTWFKNNKNKLNTNFSSFGDATVDYLRAIFQDGSLPLGYTYDQMQAAGASLPYLQLHRSIPHGLDTFNLNPTEIFLYIDVPDTANPNCVNCEPFGADSSRLRTVLTLTARGSDVWLYTKADTANNYFLFTFDVDASGDDNLHNTVWQNAGSSIVTPGFFSGFETGQTYRLQAGYNICGNFNSASLNSLDDVMRKATIVNRLWLSGKKQKDDAVPQMINTYDSLQQLFITLDTAQVSQGYTLMDSGYTNNHLFFCEPTSGVHYFFSQGAQNGSVFTSTTTCNPVLTVSANTSVADYRGIGADIYPFEYRPPVLGADTFKIIVPQGFRIARARTRNSFYTGATSSTLFTGWRTFTPATLQDTVVFAATALPPVNCLTQGVNVNTISSDTTLYWGDQKVTRIIEFTFEPLSCDSLVVPLAVTDAVINFNSIANGCTAQPPCALARPVELPVLYGTSAPPIAVFNNLSATLNNQITATRKRVCIENVRLTNPVSTQNINNFFMTRGQASHVFIAVPPSSQVPYLSNWTYYGTDTIPAIGDIIRIDSLFPITPGADPKIGNVCAYYNNCIVADTFNIYIGWNCNSYPATPFNPLSVCQVDTFPITITDANAELSNDGKAVWQNNVPATTYTLCQLFNITTCFTNTETGGVYPDSVVLANLLPSLQVQQAVAFNGQNTLLTQPLVPATANAWLLPANVMDSIGFADSAIAIGDQVCVRFTMNPTCAYYGQNTLPDITLFGTNYCGALESTTAAFTKNSFNWDNSSACTDCFTVDKSADKDTVAIGDTVTFTINVCSHNAAADTMYLTDLLPSSSVFTLYSATPPIPAYNTNFAADTCVNYIVKGTYKTTGNCPSAALQNKAVLTSGASVYKDSVCVTVIAPCWTPGTLTWANNTNSNTLASSYFQKNIIIHDTLTVSDSLLLAQCTVNMYAGAYINIIAPYGHLYLNQTVVQGCNFMWRGIKVSDYSRLTIKENSLVADGDTTIIASPKARITVATSTLRNFVFGIYLPPSTTGNTTLLYVTGTTFEFTGFKNYYANQALHGVRPNGGMLLHDWTGVIGSNANTASTNHFYNLNSGIAAYNCLLTVRNNYFENILPNNFYSGQQQNGWTVYSRGTGAGGWLKVEPVLNNQWTISKCYRGVMARNSSLDINNVRMDSVRTGIVQIHSGNLLKTAIVKCEIHASSVGISCGSNAGAQQINILQNKIYITPVNGLPGTAIALSESNTPAVTNDTINNNFIYLYDADDGIRMTNIYKPVVTNNYIEQHNQQLTKQTDGLEANNCDSALVTCNAVRNVNTTNTASRGMFFSNTRTSIVACNSMDSMAKGAYFGGGCYSTDFKGNTMRNNLLGLYVNKNGVMGSQSNKGNKFLYYRDTVGAYNANISFTGLTNSEFRLKNNTQPGSIYFPNLAQQNNGWFNVYSSITSNPYQCGSTCFIPPNLPALESFYRIVAGDSVFTEDFIPESQSMARQYLYEVISNDTTLLRDSVLNLFYTNMQVETEAQLYTVKDYFGNIGKMDSTFVPLLLMNDSLTQVYLDYIDNFEKIEDSIKIAGQDPDSLKEQWTKQIEMLKQWRDDIILQYDAVKTGNLMEGELLNSTITGGEQNEINSQRLNEIIIDLEENHYGNIDDYYNELLIIAHQCPYYGGEAVYRARAILELVDDEIIYSDDANCLLAGYYRKSDTITTQKQDYTISVRPNPANKSMYISVGCKEEDVFEFKILNAIGQYILGGKYKCNNNNIVNVKDLEQGVYTVIVEAQGKIQYFKVTIVR